jgi:hypothetical protein
MEPSALGASRYAPRYDQAGAAAISRAADFKQSKENRIKQDKGKATRLLSRLKWKAESLAASYIRALEIFQADIDGDGYIDRRGEARYPFVMGMGRVSDPTLQGRWKQAYFKKKHAESMFKVDFYEFYTLLERYLTLCLSVFDISVSGAAPKSNVNALRFITNPEFARTRPEASHQFHANLLEALDDTHNPLHIAFSNQDIRIQLGLAKDYRNHWKDADEKLLTGQSLPASETLGRKAVKLSDLNLRLMLEAILAGCEHALNIVHNRPNNPLNGGSTTSDLEIGYYNTEMEMDSAPLEYMDDPMDLD